MLSKIAYFEESKFSSSIQGDAKKTGLFRFLFLRIWFYCLLLFAGMYQIREANQMVEEFMLAANVSVAQQILKSFPLCSLLRFSFLI
jgi:hypothetical protein